MDGAVNEIGEHYQRVGASNPLRFRHEHFPHRITFPSTRLILPAGRTFRLYSPYQLFRPGIPGNPRKLCVDGDPERYNGASCAQEGGAVAASPIPTTGILPAARRCSLALLVGLITSLSWAAEPPVKAPAKPVDPAKLPPGGIVVAGEDVKDLLQQLRNELPPEKFKELLDQVEQIRKQTAQEKPEFRGNCRLSGKVDGDVAHVQVVFEFKTFAPRELVPLGCQKGWPTAASLDDKLPLLAPPNDDGLFVQVEQPGTHRLTLQLDVAVTPRGPKGGERGFELGLPRAPVTMLDSFDAPGNVRELRVGGRSIPVNELNSRSDKRRPVPLGAVDKLEVAWKVPAPEQPTEPVLAAQGDVKVTVDEAQVVTEADLSLQVLRGQANQWKLYIPPLPGTTVDLDVPAGDPRAPRVERPGDPKNPIWTIILKEASVDALPVRIRTYQPRAPGKQVPIGPFVVLGAVRQQGTVKVSAPPNLRVRPKLRGEIERRTVTDEQRQTNNVVALFSYSNLPVPVAGKENQPLPPPLELEIDTVKGAVETAVTHTLRLTPEGWLVTTEIDVNAVRTEIERLEVELPNDFEVKASPLSLVEPDLEVRDGGQGRRIGVIKLTARRSGPFKVVLTGLWPLGEEPRGGLVSVRLPRPFQTSDAGNASVKVLVPDDKELFIVRESGMQTLTPARRSHSLTTERAPTRLDIAWREYRPESPVEMQVDLTLTGRQAYVRQRLKFLTATEAPRQLILRAPGFPEGRAPVAERATLTPQGPHAWAVTLREPTLTLDYSFTPQIDKASGSFLVPLVWPEGVTHCKTRVRIWSDPGTQPVDDNGRWEELPLEVAAERDTLPALVLRADGLNVPLRLKTAAVTPLPTVAVDRVLMQAAVSDGGHQTYRARFLLGMLHARTLDIDLPAPPASINLDLLLDGKRLTGLQTIDEEGNPVETGRIIRLPIEPELYHGPVVLELRYQVAPGRVESTGRTLTKFHPVRLRGNIFPGRVRWKVGLPSDWVPIQVPGPVSVEQRWGFRGWLPAPRAAASAADLERWFTGSAEPPADEAATAGSRAAEVVCWQTQLGPLSVVHVPEQAWLLLCSLAFLLTGLALYLLTATPRWLAVAVAIVALVVLMTGVLWPTLLPVALYGSEPGIVVLALVLGFLWLRQQRYRRQLIFMPGFSRMAPGSSVVRTGGSSRLPREASTVDAHQLGAPPELTGSRNDGMGGGSRQEPAPRKP